MRILEWALNKGFLNFKIRNSKFRILVTFSLYKDSALMRSDNAIPNKSTLRIDILLSDYPKIADFEKWDDFLDFLYFASLLE